MTRQRDPSSNFNSLLFCVLINLCWLRRVINFFHRVASLATFFSVRFHGLLRLFVAFEVLQHQEYYDCSCRDYVDLFQENCIVLEHFFLFSACEQDEFGGICVHARHVRHQRCSKRYCSKLLSTKWWQPSDQSCCRKWRAPPTGRSLFPDMVNDDRSEATR